MKKLCLISLFLSLCLVLPFGNSIFASYTNIISVGDSLTDNGTSATDPFGTKRFTDGYSVWVEKLASHLGTGLYDIAYGGATTDFDNPAAAKGAGEAVRQAALGNGTTVVEAQLTNDTAYAKALNAGLKIQITNILSVFLPPLTPDDTLFTLWVGANDFLQARTYISAVDNILLGLDSLVARNAINILVPNLSDIGATPLFLSGTPGYNPVDATNWTVAFNAYLATSLIDWSVHNPDVTLFNLDIFNMFSSYTPGSFDWFSMFWVEDGFHPSTEGHQNFFTEAASLIGAPALEPATILLFGLGLVGLAGLNRRKQW